MTIWESRNLRGDKILEFISLYLLREAVNEREGKNEVKGHITR